MEGIAPTLQELVGLRALAFGRREARRGRHGVSGHALSPMRGRGMEYAESREYAIGDDARHIDWRLTARSGRPHTKLFQAERERAQPDELLQRGRDALHAQGNGTLSSSARASRSPSQPSAVAS